MKLPQLSKNRRVLLSLFLILVGALISLSTAGTASSSVTPQSVTPTAFSKPELVLRYQQLITPEKLASRLYYLASDLFEGRETTTRGQKLAAQYLAAQYRLMGLSPRGTLKTDDPLSPASFFQPFAVYRRSPKATHLTVTLNGKVVATSTFSAQQHDDLSYFDSGDKVNAAGGVVFAGYGIADDKLGYNDYAALAAKGISIDGKWVMMFLHEPLSDDDSSLLPTEKHQPSKWTNRSLIKRKAILAAGKPLGVLQVSYDSSLNQGSFEDNAALASRNAQRVGGLALSQSSGIPPSYIVSSKLADQILASSGFKSEDLRKQINQTLKPNVFELTGVKINTTVESSDALETENVAAFIEGSDPKLKDEVVVVSSHYDHLGVNSNLKGDQIFNGAADDGSGVVTSLEMAQAFMAARRDGFGPRRSILFINFSGEEKGTLGSEFYATKQPLVPLDKTVADINMDGVGGIDLRHPTRSRNYIYIVGAKDLSDDLIDTNKRVKELMATNLELTPADNFPSDQRNFQAQLVPFIYYSTGLTEHYHTTADEPNTIDYNHLTRVAQLIFGTTWQIANQDARPASIDRSRATVVGYVCPPCGYECDDIVHDHPGTCPVCGMSLVPKYSFSSAGDR